MNLVLIDPADFVAADEAVLDERRFVHLTEVLKLDRRGGSFRAGVREGAIGRAEVLEFDAVSRRVRVRFTPESEPPAPLPLILAAALPRPKSFRKVLHAAVSMGVKELHFFAAWKVDKSYWNTPFLAEPRLGEEVVLALEQAVDTATPAIHFHRRFKIFAEDELPAIARGTRLLLAHPGEGAAPCPAPGRERTTLLLGPEGGFTAYEADLLQSLGAGRISFGPRILRTEFALPALVAKLFEEV